MLIFKIFITLVLAADAAVMNHYGTNLHTTVADDAQGYHFRYVYPADSVLSVPNLSAVLNYRLVQDKVNLMYFDSPYPPVWGTVTLDNAPQTAPTPIPEFPAWAGWLGLLCILLKRPKPFTTNGYTS